MKLQATATLTPPLSIETCGINRVHTKPATSLRPDGRCPGGDYTYHTLYVAEGLCRVEERDGTVLTVTAGEIVFYRPGEYQCYHHDPKDCPISYFVHFSGDGAAAILDGLSFPHERVLKIGKCREYEELFRAMHLEYTLKKPGYEHFAASLLWQTLTVIHRRLLLTERRVVSAAGAQISRILDTLPGRLGEDLPAEVLAEECNYSIGYFSHVFRSVTGRAPAAYIALLRLQRAKELLTTGDTPIAEIAREVGFADQTYFSRFFKKHTGKSPSEYRAHRP